MTKFIINGSTTGKGSSIISVSPNSSNDPTKVNRGLIKIYRVTQDSSGNTIKSLKKTINLLQKAKTTGTGGSTGGGEEDNPNVTVYRIEVWEPSKQSYIVAQAPNGEKELTLTILGTSSTEKVVCQCYSATMDKLTGVIDNSTKVKIPMGMQCSDSNIVIDLSGMSKLVPLNSSYFTIKNTLNRSRNVDINIYPEAEAIVNDINQYTITIHLVINQLDTP